VDLLLELLMNDAALFHCRRSSLSAMTSQGVPVLQFAPGWRDQISD
jgi:hypothetical protein